MCKLRATHDNKHKNVLSQISQAVITKMIKFNGTSSGHVEGEGASQGPHYYQQLKRKSCRDKILCKWKVLVFPQMKYIVGTSLYGAVYMQTN